VLDLRLLFVFCCIVFRDSGYAMDGSSVYPAPTAARYYSLATQMRIPTEDDWEVYKPTLLRLVEEGNTADELNSFMRKEGLQTT